jgi:DNA transposition AAA+ family ATPase
MITKEQKLAVAAQLKVLQIDLGSWSKASVVAGANASTISNSMQYEANWDKVSETMWRKVANNIGVKLADAYWQLADTTNTDLMQTYLERAQFQSMFIAISHNAGQGKSTGVTMYKQCHDNVFYVEVEESWSHHQFVRRLAEVLGMKNQSGSVASLTEDVAVMLKRYAAKGKPLLIIDEANKLRPASLRLFITLYNKLIDEAGMVLIGAHDLKQIIQAGVRRDAKGFDELESRLGRTYWSLTGIFRKDVVAICEVNGIEDGATQDRIWERLKPERKQIDGTYHWVAKQDLRVLKLAIQHEQTRGGQDMKRPMTPMEATMGAQVVATV